MAAASSDITNNNNTQNLSTATGLVDPVVGNACEKDTTKCVRKLALEAVGIVAALACIRLLMYPTEPPLNVVNACWFFLLYIALGLIFKVCNVEFSDKIAAISGIELGLKMMRAL